MAKDALELIDHLRWSQCHVVGISMGGMIALELSSIGTRSNPLIDTHGYTCRWSDWSSTVDWSSTYFSIINNA